MTLATRCPQCGTTFRVVSDQLKLRQGLVKCGQCLHVFNGVETLHYIPDPAPPEQTERTEPSLIASVNTATDAMPVTAALEPRREDLPSRDATAATIATTSTEALKPALNDDPSTTISPRADDPGTSSRPLHTLAPPAAADAVNTGVQTPLETNTHVADVATDAISSASTPAPAADREPRLELPAARPYGGDALSPLTLLDVTRPRDDWGNVPPAPPVPDSFEELPAFLREKRRAPLWLRALLVIGALIAVVALAVQAAWVYRAELAAWQPDLKPVFVGACRVFADPPCDLALPRQIVALRVTHADLQPRAEGTHVLTVGLINDSTLPQAWPDIDLTLTNVRNQPEIRRTLRPDEYLALRAEAATLLGRGLLPGTEESIQIPLRVHHDAVVGYVVGIFYP